MSARNRFSDTKGPAKHRPPLKVTPRSLERAARAYLDRYADSSGHLRRVLMVKVERSVRAHDTDRAEGAVAVEEIIARSQALGLLDDAAYAEAKAASLHRRGNSLKAIAGQLTRKGLTPLEIRQAIENLCDRVGDVEQAAAATYCRKRRIGPYRLAADRGAMREKDLAALARRGFPYDVARRVIDGETPYTKS